MKKKETKKEIELIEFSEVKLEALLQEISKKFNIDFKELHEFVINIPEIKDEPVFKCSIDEFINILPKNV